MGRVRTYLFVLASVALAGCAALLGFEDTSVRGDDVDGAVPEASTPDSPTVTEAGVDAPASSLAIAPDPALLQRGQSVDVELTLARGARTGAVPFTVKGLPAGVTASGDTQIADGASKATIKLTASAVAALGSAVVSVDPGAEIGVASFTVTVTAAPGSLDETFDRDGVAADGARGNGSTFLAVFAQPDGKVLAGGFGSLGGAFPPSGWLLRRFTAAGALDAAFNAAVTGLPNDGELRGFALDGAGNVVCVGTSKPGGAGLISQLTVMRFKTSGVLDTTFGTGGTFRMPNAAAPTGSEGYGVALQPSGAIVVVGSRTEVGSDSALMIRLTSAGQLDAGFAGGGVVLPKSRFVGVSVEANGSVVAGGTDLDTNAFLLVKRGVNGAVDPAFGVGGVSKVGGSVKANGYARLTDGSLVAVGEGTAANQLTAARASATGTQIFSGVVKTLPGGQYHGVTAGLSGTLLAAGHANGGINGAGLVDRILGDGGPDKVFGDGGTAVFADPSSPDNFRFSLFAIAAQRDGRILAAGNVSNAGAVVLRLWP
ncbi:MAG: hypothetical protein KC657_07360 [Myxococcales bacterium]|nr:hypothetical protein [Myxococcales bacterium]